MANSESSMMAVPLMHARVRHFHMALCGLLQCDEFAAARACPNSQVAAAEVRPVQGSTSMIPWQHGPQTCAGVGSCLPLSAFPVYPWALGRDTWI